MQRIDVRGVDIERGAIAALGIFEAAVTMRRVGALKNWFHDGGGWFGKTSGAFSHTRQGAPEIDASKLHLYHMNRCSYV
jgi:hypothetical protein